MSWVRTTILDEKGKCDDGNNEQKCVIILSHAKTDTFKFRCECSRVDSRDRLIVTFIDSVGNLMLFD